MEAIDTLCMYAYEIYNLEFGSRANNNQNSFNPIYTSRLDKRFSSK